MNAKELYAAQAPLKEKYKAHPATAMLTLHAEGTLAEELGCTVQIGQTQVNAGLHPAAGGKEGTISPVTLLLASLVACFGVTLRAVSTHMGVVIHQGTIRAEGDLDLRGTLGIDEAVPIGLQRARLNVELDTDASQERLKTLFDAVERYAVVFQTLIPSFAIDTSYRKAKPQTGMTATDS
jgi:uncharacterized OsmC-like protein